MSFEIPGIIYVVVSKFCVDRASSRFRVIIVVSVEVLCNSFEIPSTCSSFEALCDILW